MVLKSVSDKYESSFYQYLKKLIIYSGILIIILFIGSLPWILITPQNYVRSVILTVVRLPTLLPPFRFPYPHYNYPIFWYDFLYSLKAPYLVFWFFGFLNFTYIGIVSLEIVVIFMLIYWHNKNVLNWVKFYDIIIYTTFLSYLFFPRGVYKYYFSFYVPLVVLWICFHFGYRLSNNKSKGTNWILIIVLISIIFMLLPRIYYLILIWGVFFFIS